VGAIKAPQTFKWEIGPELGKGHAHLVFGTRLTRVWPSHIVPHMVAHKCTRTTGNLFFGLFCYSRCLKADAASSAQPNSVVIRSRIPCHRQRSWPKGAGARRPERPQLF